MTYSNICKARLTIRGIASSGLNLGDANAAPMTVFAGNRQPGIHRMMASSFQGAPVYPLWYMVLLTQLLASLLAMLQPSAVLADPVLTHHGPADLAPVPSPAILSGPVPTLAGSVVPSQLPHVVEHAVLQAIREQFGVDVAPSNITRAEPKVWSDGCLGLGPVGEICTETLVRGWQVTVRHGRQHWVYRTSNSGQQVQWDQASSDLRPLFTVQPVPIPPEQLPPRLPKRAVFRAIATGNTPTHSQTTLLMRDGRILQFPTTEGIPKTAQVIGQVTKPTVKDFQRLLRQRQFGQFHQLCYPLPRSSMGTQTVVFSSKTIHTCAADIESAQLPLDLQTIVQAWRQLRLP